MSRLAALALALLAASCGSSPCARGAACADDSADSSLTRHDAGARRLDAGVAATQVVSGDAACVAQSLRAERQKRPVDAVFVVDNSASMGEEIAAVRANIDRDFAAIVDESGVDLRVVLVSGYGTGGTEVCIEPPLAGAPCAAGLAMTNGPRFFHYSQEIGSNDGLCQVLETLDHADADGRAPKGWIDWLRPESQKAFVMFSDDQTLCAYREGDTEIAFQGADPVEDALLFHETLLAKAPQQFGVAPDVRYQFFSIVGVAASAQKSEALLPHQPLNPKTCDTAPAAGLSYQSLSVITDALRYPICEGRSFDAVFRALASSVVESSSADCDFELPDAPDNRTIDPATINLVLKGSGGATPHRVRQVASARECGDSSSFYIDTSSARAAAADGEGRIQLCPSACAVVKRDRAPELEILYGCSDIAI